MYKKFIKYLLGLIVLSLMHLNQGKAQADKDLINCYFIKEQIEISTEKSTFNILRIINNSSENRKINISFALPLNWSLVGEKSLVINLQPGSTVNIPVRLIPDKEAKGGIGYSLNASLSNEKGEIFQTKYFFLTVPVKTNIAFFISNREYYLNHLNNETVIKATIHNKGNSNQSYALKIRANESLLFKANDKNEFETELFLSSGNDTVIYLPIKYIGNLNDLNYRSLIVNFNLSNQDTSIQKSVFIRYLDYKYINLIQDNEWPLVLELTSLNLFTDETKYRFLGFGKLKFKKNREIFYSYQSFPSYDTTSLKERIKNDEYLFGYKSNTTLARFGTIKDTWDIGSYGTGFSINQKISKFDLSAIGIKDYYNSNLTGLAGIAFNPSPKILIGVKFINQLSSNDFSNLYQIYMAEVKISSLINIIYGTSKYSNLPTSRTNGNYIRISINRNFKKLSSNTNAMYSSSFYPGYYSGKTEVNHQNIYKIDNNSHLQFYYNYFQTKPATIYDNVSTNYFFSTHNSKLLYSYQVNQFSTVFAGPNLDLGVANYIMGTFTDEIMVYSARAEFGYKYAPKRFLQYFIVTLNPGFYAPYKSTDSSLIYTKINSNKFSVNVIGNFWGIYTLYYQGPPSISGIMNSFADANYKMLFIMPFFRKWSNNNKLLYEFRSSYINNLSTRTSRLSIVQQIDYKLNKSWSVSGMATMNFQNIVGTQGEVYRFSSTYFEATLRKIFKWNHPGVKYYDLNTYFYSDLNGNKLRDQSEPGVENVILNLNSIQNDSVINNYSNEIGSIDLSSNNEGLSQFIDINSGFYKLTFNTSATNTEKYTIRTPSLNINLNKDTTLYIPFSEKNKVFGRVILNRDPRSALGDINLANIRVSITDGQGDVYYALTDKNGKYEIFAPVTDYYTVKINNIFNEYFDLRQAQYIIKFNGYKQFEVNFEFDERKREIIFSEIIEDKVKPNNEFTFEDVRQIKQTILKGAVRDGNSLLPVVSTLIVLDNRRGDIISKIRSSSTNGNFYTTFISGENYQLRVEADGYWIYTENLRINQITTFETLQKDILLQKINIGSKLELRNLNFKTASSELTPEAKAELENIILLLANNPRVSVELVGYTDNLEAINQNAEDLSIKRAKAVSDFLILRGINKQQLSTSGKSEANPAASNDTEAGRSQNRRVEIVISGYKQANGH